MSPSTRSVAPFFNTSVWFEFVSLMAQKLQDATAEFETEATALAETIQQLWPTRLEKPVRIGRCTMTST